MFGLIMIARTRHLNRSGIEKHVSNIFAGRSTTEAQICSLAHALAIALLQHTNRNKYATYNDFEALFF